MNTQTGHCRYCHRDAPLDHKGYIQSHHIIFENDKIRHCDVPLYVQPGTLEKHIAIALGVTHIDPSYLNSSYLLREILTLKINSDNAHDYLDKLGVSDGGYAQLSLMGRIKNLVDATNW